MCILFIHIIFKILKAVTFGLPLQHPQVEPLSVIVPPCRQTANSKVENLSYSKFYMQ